MLAAELSLQPAFDAIGAPLEQAAEAAVLGQDIRTIAVLDSGVHWRHPYLRSHCTDPGWDFIEERPDATPDEHSDHGTQMAGVIAAFAQRVNMRLAILPLRVTGVFASGIGAGLSSSRIVRAIELAATRGADVIVIARSWPQDSLAVRNAIRAAASVGALIVISAGNASADIDRTRCIPACYAREFPDHVLTVRALGTTSKRPSGSNYFTDLPLLAAPGWQIKTTSGSAYYARRFGQSSAAAAIVGAAAALVSHRLLEPAQRAPAAVAHWLRSHARRERHCEGGGLNLLGRDEHLELDLRDLPRANQGKCRTMDV